MASTWEDTVMNEGAINGCCHRISTSPEPYAFTENDGTLVSPVSYKFVRLKELCEAQAEITWHARDKEVEEAENRGVKKVVEFIESHLEFDELATRFVFDTDQEAWKPQLKEWGIEVKE